MTKRLNPNKVRIALTYDTEELARLLGVIPATIRNMVKRGLPVLASQKPYLFSGEATRDFIIAQNKQNKCPMSMNQMRCMTCRTGKSPLGMAVSQSPLTPKTALLRGVCESCGGTCVRIISVNRLQEFSTIFNIITSASGAA